jgi:hypothetical protein
VNGLPLGTKTRLQREAGFLFFSFGVRRVLDALRFFGFTEAPTCRDEASAQIQELKARAGEMTQTAINSRRHVVTAVHISASRRALALRLLFGKLS